MNFLSWLDAKLTLRDSPNVLTDCNPDISSSISTLLYKWLTMYLSSSPLSALQCLKGCTNNMGRGNTSVSLQCMSKLGLLKKQPWRQQEYIQIGNRWSCFVCTVQDAGSRLFITQQLLQRFWTQIVAQNTNKKSLMEILWAAGFISLKLHLHKSSALCVWIIEPRGYTAYMVQPLSPDMPLLDFLIFSFLPSLSYLSIKTSRHCDSSPASPLPSLLSITLQQLYAFLPQLPGP